jgi:hypothetical protein
MSTRKVTSFAPSPHKELAREGIDWKAFIADVSLSDIIAELRSRGFTVWPSDRVIDTGDSWTIRKTALERRPVVVPIRPGAPRVLAATTRKRVLKRPPLIRKVGIRLTGSRPRPNSHD